VEFMTVLVNLRSSSMSPSCRVSAFIESVLCAESNLGLFVILGEGICCFALALVLQDSLRRATTSG
jgi:hypothetical protein